MLNLHIRFSLPGGYESAFASLDPTEHVLTFALNDGSHLVESNSVVLGTVHGFEARKLTGRFSFRYHYDETSRTITICGTDFNSQDAMCLATVPEGTDEVCLQRATGGYSAEDLNSNPHWNYQTPLTPGLPELLADLVRTVNDRLIGALKQHDAPRLIVQVRKHPPKLPADEHHKMLVVYRDGKLHRLHDANVPFEPGDVAVSIESVFGGEVTLNSGENFANVIGSTSDPKIAGKSWLQLWSTYYGITAVACTSIGYNGFSCGTSLVGGHVIGGTHAQHVPSGSNAVWIFPICVQHNNNDHVYMAGITYLEGIWLKNYLGP